MVECVLYQRTRVTTMLGIRNLWNSRQNNKIGWCQTQGWDTQRYLRIMIRGLFNYSTQFKLDFATFFFFCYWIWFGEHTFSTKSTTAARTKIGLHYKLNNKSTLILFGAFFMAKEYDLGKFIFFFEPFELLLWNLKFITWDPALTKSLKWVYKNTLGRIYLGAWGALGSSWSWKWPGRGVSEQPSWNCNPPPRPSLFQVML